MFVHEILAGQFEKAVKFRSIASRLTIGHLLSSGVVCQGVLNTGGVLASVRDPRRWCAAALT
jgi:hypothetical protein